MAKKNISSPNDPTELSRVLRSISPTGEEIKAGERVESSEESLKELRKDYERAKKEANDEDKKALKAAIDYEKRRRKEAADALDSIRSKRGVVARRQFLGAAERDLSEEALASIAAEAKRDPAVSRAAGQMAYTTPARQIQETIVSSRAQAKEAEGRVREVDKQIASKIPTLIGRSDKEQQTILAPLFAQKEAQQRAMEESLRSAGQAEKARSYQSQVFGDISSPEVRAKVLAHRWKGTDVDVADLQKRRSESSQKAQETSEQYYQTEQKIAETAKSREEAVKGGDTGKAKELSDTLQKLNDEAEKLTLSFLALESETKEYDKVLKTREKDGAGGDKGGFIQKVTRGIAHVGDLGLDVYKAWKIDRPMGERQNLGAMANIQAQRINTAFSATQGDMSALIAASGLGGAKAFGEQIGGAGRFYHGGKMVTEGIRAAGDLTALGLDAIKGGGVGGAAGQATGAAMGSAVPVVGTAIGATAGRILGTGFGAIKGGLDSKGGFDSAAEFGKKWGTYGITTEELKLRAEQTGLSTNEAISKVVGPMRQQGYDYMRGMQQGFSGTGGRAKELFGSMINDKYVDQMASMGIAQSDMSRYFQSSLQAGTRAFDPKTTIQTARRFERAALGSMDDYFASAARLSTVSTDPNKAVEGLRDAIESGSAAGVKAGIAGAPEFKDLVEGIAGMSEKFGAYGADYTKSMGGGIGFAMGSGSRMDINEALTRRREITSRMDAAPNNDVSATQKYASFLEGGVRNKFTMQEMLLNVDTKAETAFSIQNKLSKAKSWKGAQEGLKEMSASLGISEEEIQKRWTTPQEAAGAIGKTFVLPKHFGRTNLMQETFMGHQAIGSFYEAVQGKSGTEVLSAMKQAGIDVGTKKKPGGPVGLDELKKFMGIMGISGDASTMQNILKGEGPLLTPVAMLSNMVTMNQGLRGTFSKVADINNTEFEAGGREAEARGQAARSKEGGALRDWKGIQGDMLKLGTDLKTIIQTSLDELAKSATQKGITITNGTITVINDVTSQSRTRSAVPDR